MTSLPGCSCCDHEAAADAPPRERVHVGDGWRAGLAAELAAALG